MWAYSQDLRERIVKAVKEEGLSQSEVARRFSVSRQTVYNYLKLAAGRGLETKRPLGRVRKLSSLLEQAVVARAEQHDITLQEHCDWLKAEHGIGLDPSNPWRLLNRSGISWKKSLKPRQQDEIARREWREALQQHEVTELVFLDETGAWLDMPRLYGWARTSERIHDTVTKGRKGKVNLIAAVSTQGLDIQRCFHFDGVVNSSAFSTYLEQVLVPSLKPGSVVVMDNFSVHHSKQVGHTLEQAGCRLVYLPTYSPDLNPIELVFAKVKASLRKARAQTSEALKEAFAHALQHITPKDVLACFRHCGYL